MSAESPKESNIERAMKDLRLAGVNPLGGRDDNDFESQWEILGSALREIHTKNASQLSFEQIYRASYKIVLKKQGDILYQRVKQFEEQWFGGEVLPGIRKLITPNLLSISRDGGAGVAGVTANERRMTGEDFLRGLKAAWEDHITTMNMTTDVLMYMDRVYCTDNRKPSIYTTSMGLFRQHVLRSAIASGSDVTVSHLLNNVLLDQISMERDGDVIDKPLIRAVVYMYEGLYESDDESEKEKLYLTVFQPVFLQHAEVHYKKECETLLRQSDASTWLRQTRKRLAEEEVRCQTTLSTLTTGEIARVVENEMVIAHLTEFLAMEGSGIKAMIQNDRYEDLTLLYQLISRVDPSKSPLKIALQARVVELGSDINRSITESESSTGQAAQPEEGEPEAGDKSRAPKQSAASKQTASAIRWVDEVLALKDKFDTMWRQCLSQDLILQTALTKSFSDFINLFPRCSEYVSLFIDDNLKRGIKGKTETEIEVVLEKATTLLRYIQDKDMFERYYKKHLARRLLHGKSESADVEKQMITRMKMEIGNAFTTKLEGMFKDMTMSDDLTSGYRAFISSLGDLDRKQVDLCINVLTTNFWPMESMGGSNSKREDGTPISCSWPPEIMNLQESFKKFYLKERNGRKLTWLGFLGSADIKCVFPKIPGKEGLFGRERRHELNVPTYGMIILLLFNDLADRESLTYEAIQQSTNIPAQDLSRMLYTLSVLPKARVLTKDPANKELPKPGDRFSFNASFTSKAVKIKAPVMVGAVNKVEGEDERKETEERNDEHRGYVIDTVIVRIMKARKTLTHQILFSEVIQQLSQRFSPNINMMKKRVDSLIEREYLERVEDAAVPTYLYLA
ncbi:related to cullulin 3 [Rhynchosporium secalis]|uniref:Related to cullulin 3 n=1 Tax=Rhynchosporium secalis TaxID=38038 RepID=A0A1E1MDL0_RHYSE|nr:related to cullulin 3 [Rhynchosporium secalis]